MKHRLWFLFFTLVSCLCMNACNSNKVIRPKKEILHASTLYERGNSLKLFDDGTYTVMCFLFDSSNGRYRMEHDTIYLEPPFKGKRCDLKFGTLVIKHEKDSSYWDAKQAKNLSVKIPTSSEEGSIYELDGANKIIESPYTYQMIK